MKIMSKEQQTPIPQPRPTLPPSPKPDTKSFPGHRNPPPPPPKKGK